MNFVIRKISASIVLLSTLLSCNEKSPAGDLSTLSVYNTEGSAVEALSFGSKESETIIRVMSSTDWNIVSSDEGWLTADPSSGGSGVRQVTVKVTANSNSYTREGELYFEEGGERVKTITVSQSGSSEIPVNLPKADLLDVVFYNDGSAADISGNSVPVSTVASSSLVTYYSDIYSRYVSHFNHEQGASVSSGYFKADYASVAGMAEALADGHSLEVVFRTNIQSDGSKEIKMFSAMESGGTGFLISTSSYGNQLTFLPNVSTSGSSNWIWTGSGINPEAGRYYHAVGVWNKSEGKSYIYVDGELKGTATASGNLVFPSSTASYWFGIGADASASSTAQSAWNGEVVLARVYDDPLTQSQVSDLYDAVALEQQPEFFTINDVQLLADCEIGIGYRYHIYGSGFKEGDIISVESIENTSEIYKCEGLLGDESISFVIPDSFKTGKYRLMVQRGTVVFPLGTAEMTVTDNPQITGKVGVIAHRGYHTGGAPENSIAALKAAQELGVTGAEFDVWVTTDSVAVINHDSTVSGYSQVLQNSTYAELSNIYLSNGEPLPTLESYLQQGKEYPDVRLVLEIKTHSTEAANRRAVATVLKTVSDMELDDQVDYIAFSYDICCWIVAEKPNALVQYLNGDKAPSVVYSDGIGGIDYTSSVLISNPQWIEQAHDLGMVVNVWTVNDSQQMLNFISYGVDYITTDYPNVLQGLLEKPFITKD